MSRNLDLPWLHENFSARRLRGPFGGAKCRGAGCTWSIAYVNDVSTVVPLMELHLKNGHTLSTERVIINTLISERVRFLSDIADEIKAVKVAKGDEEYAKLNRLHMEKKHWEDEVLLLRGVLIASDRS